MRNLILLSFLWSLAVSIKGDNPCILREISHDKKVCVCNGNYCDTISRVSGIEEGKYVSFISSKEGLRFSNTVGNLRTSSEMSKFSFADSSVKLSVNLTAHYQEIVGFGGAFTDATGINILSLGKAAQRNLLRSYLSNEGLEYNLCRVPIGGTDFSTHTYSYDDGPADPNLANFSLAEEDYKYKIPIIKYAKKISSRVIHFVTASWSPPTWMKTSHSFSGVGFLQKKYYDSFAKYLIRFLDEYKKHKINFYALSTGNEPVDGVIPIENFNSLGWMPWSQADWIVNHIGPQLRNSSHNNTLLMAFDDQRIFLPWIIDMMVASNKKLLDYVDGFAVHWYLDFLIGDWVVKDLHEQYPNKFILYTEACQGDKPWEKKVDLGSWWRGEGYLENIIENLNSWVTGWIDWNMALNLGGGPNWAKNFVDSPILVNASADEFYKQPTFYAMGHVSKFIEQGAVRVGISPTAASGIHATAVQNPDGRVVIVLLNKNDHGKEVVINIQEKGGINLELPASSFATVLC